MQLFSHRHAYYIIKQGLMELNTPKELLIWEAVRFLEGRQEEAHLLQQLARLAAEYTAILQNDLPSIVQQQSEQTTLSRIDHHDTATIPTKPGSEHALFQLKTFLNLRNKITRLTTTQKAILLTYQQQRDQLLVALLTSGHPRIQQQVFNGLHAAPKTKAVFESIIRKKYPVYDDDHIEQAYNDLFVQLDKKIKEGSFDLHQGTLLHTFLFDIGIKKYIDLLPKPPVDHSQLHLSFRPYGLLLLEKRYQIKDTPASTLCRKAAAMLVQMIKKGSIAPPLKHALIIYYFEIIESLVQKLNS